MSNKIGHTGAFPINKPESAPDSWDMTTNRVLSLIIGTVIFLAACTSTDNATREAASESVTTTTTTAAVAGGEGNPALTGDTEGISSPPAGIASTNDDTPDVVSDPSSTTTPEAPDATVPEENDGAPLDEPRLCLSPELLQTHYVDVAADDTDGGLNVRELPGVENAVVATLPRGTEVSTLEGCSAVGATDWWQVTTTDGDTTGWVSKDFLSETFVATPGLGQFVTDTENVDLTAETLDELIAAIADSYGFDDDRVITLVGEAQIADAVGGEVTYDITGLKDDSVNGFRVNINFLFEKSEPDALEIIGFRAVGITNWALCSRGVTDDGLCI